MLCLIGLFHQSSLLNIEPTYLAEEAVLDLISTSTRKVILDHLPVLAVPVDERNQHEVLLDTPLTSVDVGFQVIFVVVSNLLVGTA